MRDENLYLSGNLPSANDRVGSPAQRLFRHVLITEVGMLYNGEDLAGIDRIALRTSSTVCVGGCMSVSIAASCLTSNSNGSLYVYCRPELLF